MSLARLAEESLDKYGEYVALAFEGRRYTNLDQQRDASRLAHALRRLGVGVGDRVVVMLPNCPEVTQSYAAILKCGGVVVPVIFLLGDREVAHILADSEAKVVITAADMLWKVEAQIGVLPTLRHVLLVDGGGDGLTRSLAAETAEEPDTFPTVDRRADDLAVILYTSGTTGVPKGVALSHDNLESNARAAASLNELGREDWAVAVLPLSHSYGLTVMNAGHILGSRAALLRWFNPEAVLQTIQEFRAVSMSAVPTMLIYLLNYPEAGRFDTRSMRVWGSGAAPLPVEIVEPFERKFGGRILEGYGLTEASPVVSAHRLSGPRRIGSVGQALPGVEISIQDDLDRPLPAGELGEVCVRGRNVMAGYYRNPEETARTVRAGWLHTGDMGRLDDDGFLFIVERKKDLIIRGGFNIYPREVEEVLYAHPKVAEAAVVGTKDPLMGEDVLAFVVLRSGEHASAEEIGAFCEGRLARFKCPKQIRFVESLPKSPIGKILRKELRTQT
ncbi:MAG TPA: long-chain fatty acid--CoA ligase [Verrucomicrobiae bacterium]|jgi:long-chain acyl-CoA synthetase|nr:long-chain fatty acid--CoA ligase [Verrucomicrobiae bacterium]